MKQGIAERRKERGWTQEELADRAGVSQSLVSSAERGVKIRREYAEKIEHALSGSRDNTRNSSDEAQEQQDALHTEQNGGNGVSMPTPSPRLLSAVHPAVPHAARITPEVERAIGRAFDAEKHTLSDLKAVERIAPELPTESLSDADLKAFFRDLVDAAAQLRAQGANITAGALVVAVFAARRPAKR